MTFTKFNETFFYLLKQNVVLFLFVFICKPQCENLESQLMWDVVQIKTLC